MARRERLIVVYDIGAASLSDTLSSLSPLGDLIFVVPQTAHIRAVLPMLQAAGRVVALRTDLDELGGELWGYGASGIVTYADTMLVAAARLAARLGLPGNEVAVAETLTHKHRARAVLNAAGIQPVATARVRTPEDWPAALDQVGLPAVVKPSVGIASRNTHLVTAEETGRALVERLLAAEPELVLEAYLCGRPTAGYGDYVSVESACAGDRVVHLAVTGKFPLVHPFREVGQFWPAPLPAAEQTAVLELTTRALKALGVRMGLTHTEVKLTPDGPAVIEVNGRLGGHIDGLARRSVGLNLVRGAARMAIGHAGEELAGVAEAAVRVQALDHTHFQYMSAAPGFACRLAAVEGGREVRRAQGIDEYRQYARAGADLDPVATTPLDLLSGRAARFDKIDETIDNALEKVTFTFGTPGGAWTASGRYLRQEVT